MPRAICHNAGRPRVLGLRAAYRVLIRFSRGGVGALLRDPRDGVREPGAYVRVEAERFSRDPDARCVPRCRGPQMAIGCLHEAHRPRRRPNTVALRVSPFEGPKAVRERRLPVGRIRRQRLSDRDLK